MKNTSLRFKRENEANGRTVTKRVSNQKNLAYKVQEIAAMQEKNGYMVQIKRDGENSFVIEKQNCPLKEIAERFRKYVKMKKRCISVYLQEQM